MEDVTDQRDGGLGTDLVRGHLVDGGGGEVLVPGTAGMSILIETPEDL